MVNWGINFGLRCLNEGDQKPYNTTGVTQDRTLRAVSQETPAVKLSKQKSQPASQAFNMKMQRISENIQNLINSSLCIHNFEQPTNLLPGLVMQSSKYLRIFQYSLENIASVPSALRKD